MARAPDLSKVVTLEEQISDAQRQSDFDIGIPAGLFLFEDAAERAEEAIVSRLTDIHFDKIDTAVLSLQCGRSVSSIS